MFCHRSEGASWLEEWKELMIKKNNYDFLRILYHQHHNFFRLRPGQAESRQSLVAHPGVGAAGPGCGRGFCRRVPWHDGVPPQNLKAVVPVRRAGYYAGTYACCCLCLEIR